MNNLIQIYTKLIKYLLALITGTILFTPQLLDIISKPYIWNPAIYIFWISAFFALGSLIVALYISEGMKNLHTNLQVWGIGAL